MAEWDKQGGVNCHQCSEMELIELGIKTCDTCTKPRPLPANLLALEIYGYSPLLPIPMTDGLVMLDITAIEFLFKVHEVPFREQRALLEKIAIYHGIRYSVDKRAKNKGKGDET